MPHSAVLPLRTQEDSDEYLDFPHPRTPRSSPFGSPTHARLSPFPNKPSSPSPSIFGPERPNVGFFTHGVGTTSPISSFLLVTAIGLPNGKFVLFFIHTLSLLTTLFHIDILGCRGSARGRWKARRKVHWFVPFKCRLGRW
jgi:hypothetical protein